jgi:hypothetical protein
MNRRRRLDKGKYLTVFAITTLIFIVGILIGNYFSSQKMKQIDYIGQDLKTDTVAMELQYELIAEDPCAHVNNTPLADELYEMASKLDYMENRMGEDDRNNITHCLSSGTGSSCRRRTRNATRRAHRYCSSTPTRRTATSARSRDSY